MEVVKKIRFNNSHSVLSDLPVKAIILSAKVFWKFCLRKVSFQEGKVMGRTLSTFSYKIKLPAWIWKSLICLTVLVRKSDRKKWLGKKNVFLPYFLKIYSLDMIVSFWSIFIFFALLVFLILFFTDPFNCCYSLPINHCKQGTWKCVLARPPLAITSLDISRDPWLSLDPREIDRRSRLGLSCAVSCAKFETFSEVQARQQYAGKFLL